MKTIFEIECWLKKQKEDTEISIVHRGKTIELCLFDRHGRNTVKIDTARGLSVALEDMLTELRNIDNGLAKAEFDRSPTTQPMMQGVGVIIP